MNESQLMKTMIETIKYDDYDQKEELLTILRNSLIMFNKTNSFTKKSWQCYENIDLRVPITLLKEARNLHKLLERVASIVYVETEQYSFGGLLIKPKPVDIESPELTEHDVIFDEIKDTIIQGIRNANYLVYFA